jgi:hypothetical protein
VFKPAAQWIAFMQGGFRVAKTRGVNRVYYQKGLHILVYTVYFQGRSVAQKSLISITNFTERGSGLCYNTIFLSECHSQQLSQQNEAEKLAAAQLEMQRLQQEQIQRHQEQLIQQQQRLQQLQVRIPYYYTLNNK